MGRWMGLDYGSRTIGVALSDPTGLIASPLETITRERENQLRPSLRRITELCGSLEIARIVIGLPLNMDDTEGERAEKTRAFAALLKERLARELPQPPELVLWDERLSTVEADEILEESGVPRAERKESIDRIAAALILEDHMKNGRN